MLVGILWLSTNTSHFMYASIMIVVHLSFYRFTAVSLLSQIQNADWQSMHFKHVASTAMLLDDVRKLIMETHSVPSSTGLRIFLGAGTSEANLLKPEDFNLSLEQLSVSGGSRNDQVEQVSISLWSPSSRPASDISSHHFWEASCCLSHVEVFVCGQIITYEYQPFKSVLNLPRFTRPPTGRPP